MTTTSPAAHLVLDARCDLGESPVYDERTGRLFFVDINSSTLHVFDTGAANTADAHVSVRLPEPVGCVVPTNDPDVVLAALSHTIVQVDIAQRVVRGVVASVPEGHAYDAPNMRFNDGKASPAGVLLVGHMHSGWREGKAGRLYRMVAPGGRLEEVMGPEEVTLPNGMTWDEARGTMYFVDSATGTITAYSCDAQGIPQRANDGRLQGQVVVTVPREEGVPDGMTIDARGRLWVALADGGAVACYDADTGQQVHKVALPVKRPTACTFGGPGLRTLFVTTRVEKGEGASAHWGGLFGVEISGAVGAAPASCVQL